MVIPAALQWPERVYAASCLGPTAAVRAPDVATSGDDPPDAPQPAILMEGAYRDIATTAVVVRYREPHGPQPASMCALATLAAQRLVERRNQFGEGVVHRRGRVAAGRARRLGHVESPLQVRPCPGAAPSVA